MDTHRLLHSAVGFGLALGLLSFHLGPTRDPILPFSISATLGTVLTAGVAKEMWDTIQCQHAPPSCESTAKHLGDIGATVAGGVLAVGVHLSFGGK